LGFAFDHGAPTRAVAADGRRGWLVNGKELLKADYERYEKLLVEIRKEDRVRSTSSCPASIPGWPLAAQTSRWSGWRWAR